MLNVLIVDDEKYIRNELRYFLEKYKDLKICGEASNGREAIELTQNLNPDIVFLDIELQDMNGLLVARNILENENHPYIVFATAYDNYAIQGFELDAVDYIVKPFLEERIKRTLDRIKKRLHSGDMKKHKEISNNEANVMKDKLCVSKNDKLILLDLENIQYIHSEHNDMFVKTNKDIYSCSYTLKDLEDRFKDGRMIRTHKSYIVNIDYIDEIIPWFNYTFKIILKGEEKIEIPVSRNYMKKFKNKLGI